jgi:hypothetical protein
VSKGKPKKIKKNKKNKRRKRKWGRRREERLQNLLL